jgi:hypothetical protein
MAARLPMHSVILLVFTFVAHSAGAVAGNLLLRDRPRTSPHPSLLESFFFLIPAAASVVWRRSLWTWPGAFLWCLAVFLIAGILRIAFGRRANFLGGGSGDFAPLTVAAPRLRSPASRAWYAWKILAQAVADFQARVLLTVCYFALVSPLALWVTRSQDPLRLRTRVPAWLERTPTAATVDAARRQF